MCRRVECSILILDTIFDNKYHGIFHMELFHGIQGGYAPIPYGIDHSMIIPHGIHDVYGIRNWLGPLPTSIPWIPYGILGELYWGR